jgi:hypothetical protein
MPNIIKPDILSKTKIKIEYFWRTCREGRDLDRYKLSISGKSLFYAKEHTMIHSL